MVVHAESFTYANSSDITRLPLISLCVYYNLYECDNQLNLIQKSFSPNTRNIGGHPFSKQKVIVHRSANLVQKHN